MLKNIENTEISDAKHLISRLLEGNVSAYSTTGFTPSQNKLLQKWVRKGIVLKQQAEMWSGAGNRYYYYLIKDPFTSNPIKNVMSERNRRLQNAGIPKPSSLYKFTPEERRLKYQMARQAGLSSSKAQWVRDLWSTHFFRHIGQKVPPKQDRRAMGILHNPTYKDIQKEIRELKKEMKDKGIRKISIFNGGLSSDERYYNGQLFRLTTLLEKTLKNPTEEFVGDICRWCGAKIHGVLKPLIICPKCRRRQTTGAIVPQTHSRDWKEEPYKEGEEMRSNPRNLKLVDYDKPGWHYGDHVKLLNNQGRKDEFSGSGGIIIAAEGEYLRVKLDKPIHIEGIGIVKDDLWMPYLLRKTKKRNPGAAWHLNKKLEIAKGLSTSKLSNTGTARAYWEGKEAAHDESFLMSAAKHMDNPISKHSKGIGSLLIPAVIIGIIWWFSKNNNKV